MNKRNGGGFVHKFCKVAARFIRLVPIGNMLLLMYLILWFSGTETDPFLLRTSQPTIPCKQGPRILMGIMSMDTEIDRQQRQIIRDTYLSYFRRSEPQKSSTNPICSLADVQKYPYSVDHCQLVYAFVIGANPNGPTKLLLQGGRDDRWKTAMTVNAQMIPH